MSHHEDLGVDSQEDADRKYLAVKRANEARNSPSPTSEPSEVRRYRSDRDGTMCDVDNGMEAPGSDCYESYIRETDYATLRASLDAAERDRDALRGIKPELPPMPPNGHGLPRYGLRWNGPTEALATPMADGYWTPWHLAERERDGLRKALNRIRERASIVVAEPMAAIYDIADICDAALSTASTASTVSTGEKKGE